MGNKGHHLMTSWAVDMHISWVNEIFLLMVKDRKGSMANRQDFPYHAGQYSYNFIEMHGKWTFQGQITVKNLIFLRFYWKISVQSQWCRGQMEKVSLSDITVSDRWVFDMHVSDFSTFVWFLLIRALKMHVLPSFLWYRRILEIRYMKQKM